MKRFHEINHPGIIFDASGLENPADWLWEKSVVGVNIWYPAKKIEKNEEKFSEDSFIKEVDEGWHSGGNIYLDLITLKDGSVLVISEDAIDLYKNRKSFDDGDAPLFEHERYLFYRVFSPDGLEFHPTHMFTSEEEAWEAFENDYKNRFEPQGYYSTVNHTRIPLDELKNYCSVKPI